MLFWLYINKSTYIYTYMGYIFLCWICLIFKKRSSQNIDWRCIVEKKAKKRNVCVNIHSYVYTLFFIILEDHLELLGFSDFFLFFCMVFSVCLLSLVFHSTNLGKFLCELANFRRKILWKTYFVLFQMETSLIQCSHCYMNEF